MKINKKLLILTGLEIFLCFIFISSTTWAWFSFGVESSSNTINSSNFDINVTFENVIIENSLVELEGQKEYGYSVSLLNKEKYTFQISVADNSTALNGFCKIIAQNSESKIKYYYKTVVIQGEESDILSIEIETVEDNVTLTFIPNIGIAANDSFIDNKCLEIDFTK